MSDVLVNGQGTLVLFTPTSDTARAWFDEHVGQDNGYQPSWPTVIVEPRYAGDILYALLDYGFEVGDA